MGIRLYRFPDLKAAGVPFSRAHLDNLERVGKFPKRFRLGANSVAWIGDEVDRWIGDKIAARVGAEIVPLHAAPEIEPPAAPEGPADEPARPECMEPPSFAIEYDLRRKLPHLVVQTRGGIRKIVSDHRSRRGATVALRKLQHPLTPPT